VLPAADLPEPRIIIHRSESGCKKERCFLSILHGSPVTPRGDKRGELLLRRYGRTFTGKSNGVMGCGTGSEPVNKSMVTNVQSASSREVTPPMRRSIRPKRATADRTCVAVGALRQTWLSPKLFDTVV
jgi:hypothetical protein